MIDHYEIQSRRPGQEWEHVGNKYPDYNWEVYKPWYLFGTGRRARITNREAALKQAACDLVGLLAESWANDTGEHVRIILWCRGLFGRLWKVKIAEA